jgi:hypothetical protein
MVKRLLGFNEQTWKHYSQFIKSNKESFKQKFESMHISNYIYHPKLDFNLPIDMGGFGELYNTNKYSRVYSSPA